MGLGHNIWAYAYLRVLYNRNPDVYYATLLAEPNLLLPVAYTPTVGEACQKFGQVAMIFRALQGQMLSSQLLTQASI